MQTAKDLYDALVAFHKPEDIGKVDIKTLRFVLYARKSSTSDERQERSIPDQLLDCFDAAKRLEIPIENIKVVKEQESAKEPDIRPLFSAMIEDIKHGKYDAILTWHPDRLARNMIDAGKVIDLLDKKIIKNLSFATFSFEDTPMGKMLLGISFVLSKQYSDHLSEVVTRGQRRALEEGKSIHTAKHGYYKDPNGFLRPDGEYWVLVKRAFALRAEGKTQEEVAEFMNKNHYTRAPSGDKPRVPYCMTVNKASVMLRDPTYAGVHMYGNVIVNFTELFDFEPAVSVDTFLSINQLSDIGAAFKMVKPMKKKQATKADFLRGLVVCSFCNKPMSSGIVGKKNKLKNTDGIYYYRCETKGCERKKKSLRARVVMQFVLDFFEEHFFTTENNYKHFCKTIAEESKKTREGLNSQLMSLRRALTENEKTKERIKTLLLQNDQTIIEHFKGDMTKTEQEALNIIKEINKTEDLLAKSKEAPFTYETFLELFTNTAKTLKKNDNLNYRDQTIRLFFSNFVVDNEKVASYSLQQPFSDFLKTGDFLNGRASGT